MYASCLADVSAEYEIEPEHVVYASARKTSDVVRIPPGDSNPLLRSVVH